MHELIFHLNLTREQALRYYQGSARSIIVTAETGQRISFPAEHIRPFVDVGGVHGHFRIRFDKDNKLEGLFRI